MGFRIDKNLIVLSLGMFTILIAMAVVMTISLDRMKSNIDRMNTVVHIQSSKTALVTQMVSSARERTLIILRMLVSDDPFVRDELMLDFNSQGAKFVQSRMSLLEMDLSMREKKLLDIQGKMTADIVPLQRDIVDLILDDNLNQNITSLFEVATPKQDLVLDTLSNLLSVQQKSAADALKEAGDEYQTAIIMLGLLALSVFIVCVMIAIYVIRHTTHSRSLLFQEKERAQITLHSIGDGVITTDSEGRIERLNTIAEYLTGWDNASARGVSHLR